MKLANFNLGGQSIDLEWNADGYADLHNDFDFTSLTYEPTGAKLILEWAKSSGEWAKNAPCRVVRLVFEGVNYFNVKGRDPEYPINEDDCLRDICRTPIEERHEFDNYWEDKNPPAEYDLQLVFQSEWGIKVNADTVRLELES
ncbi:hypothetical protein [Hymenobacter psychrophilus]|uniref:Uncharacterized protein n=1 Tax=Hymenobacter psychrophilus TaxID=651662 RepID=A0A1H3NM83_9BACT|nr:hypothetical protein [Hymenobacter psychrophilus]SDY89329.1 hypothetical protein SAMN04488069_11750 [Hymenobacter psychrophilus]